MIRFIGAVTGTILVGVVFAVYILNFHDQKKEPYQVSLPIVNTGNTDLDSTPDDRVNETIETITYQFIFWGPFRTRISALGFSKQMEKMTGLTMDIIEKEPFRFMVAFQYKNEADRLNNLKLIEEKGQINIRESENI